MNSRSFSTLLAVLISLIALGLAGCGGGNSSPAPAPTPLPPSVISVSPSVLASGAPDSTITVAGTGFEPSSSVLVNGTRVGTTFNSPAQLQAAIPASLLTTAGTLQISVANPASGGGNSGNVSLSVVAVGSLSVMATPASPSLVNGPWTISAIALDSAGKPVAHLPVSLGASTGTMSPSTGVTDANGGLVGSITPPASINPSQPVVITATSGSQTAAINIVFQSPPAGAAALGASSSNQNALTGQATLTTNIQPFAIGTSGVPSANNPFLASNSCYTNAALTTTVTTACQQNYTQNGLNIQPSNLINQACNVVSAIGTVQDVLSCVGTSVTVISCLLSGTGIGAAICAGTLDFTLGSLGPECAQFIATQLTQRLLGDAAAGLLQQLFILQDPTNPANLISEGCTVVQDLFPPSTGNSGGRVYVADSSVNVIHVYDSQGAAIAVAGIFPGLSTPDGMAYDPSNQHIYVANLGNNTVTVYDLEGNPVNLGAGAFAGLNDPEDITFNPINKFFYINEPTPNQVVVFDENGNSVPLPAGAFPNLSLPFGLGWDSANGLIYVTNAGNNTITVYDQFGSQIQTALGAFSGLISPDDVSWDPLTGNLYVTGAASSLAGCSVNQVFVYTPDGTAAAASGGFPGLNGPDAVASSGNAAAPRYYVTNICGGSVSVYDRNGSPVPMPAGAFGNLVQPTGALVVP